MQAIIKDGNKTIAVGQIYEFKNPSKVLRRVVMISSHLISGKLLVSFQRVDNDFAPMNNMPIVTIEYHKGFFNTFELIDQTEPQAVPPAPDPEQQSMAALSFIAIDTPQASLAKALIDTLTEEKANGAFMRLQPAPEEPTFQQAVMKRDPMTGEQFPFPSHAAQYRDWHGCVAWLYNPWTGEPRHPADIGSDVQGVLIQHR